LEDFGDIVEYQPFYNGNILWEYLWRYGHIACEIDPASPINVIWVCLQVGDTPSHGNSNWEHVEKPRLFMVQEMMTV
jgi:hypothetical protein